MRRVLLALCLFGLTPALLWATADTTPTVEPANEDDVRVQLKSSGSGTPTEVRYRFHAQDNRDLHVEMRLSQRSTYGALETGWRVFPTLRIHFKIKVYPPTANGQAKVEFTVKNAEVIRVKGPMVPAMTMAALKADALTLKGLVLTATVSAQGLVSNSTVKPAGKTRGDLVEDLQATIQQLVVPLPREPIAPGARWTVHSSQAFNGLTVRTQTTYMLESIKKERQGYRAKATVRVKQRSRPVHIKPKEKGTVRLSFQSYQAKGQGRVQFELFSPLAQTNFDIKSKSLAVGTSKYMRQNVRLDYHLRTKTWSKKK